MKNSLGHSGMAGCGRAYPEQTPVQGRCTLSQSSETPVPCVVAAVVTAAAQPVSLELQPHIFFFVMKLRKQEKNIYKKKVQVLGRVCVSTSSPISEEVK